eukprot:scaffold12566_cov76-Skeletonema_dohrnii-CCMP3373.AAC.2
MVLLVVEDTSVIGGDGAQHKGHGVHPAIAPRPAVDPLLHRAYTSPPACSLFMVRFLAKTKVNKPPPMLEWTNHRAYAL